jgi:hypothetical protein
MSERAPYSRVYWSVVDDPKFVSVYDDDRHLATWLRLLIAADALWPASCPMPGNARKASVAALVDAGLIDLGTGYRFRVHGLDAERGRRRDAARTGTKGHPDGTQTGTERVSRPGTKPRQDETSQAELSARDGLPNLDRSALDALEARTGHVASQAGERQLSEYDRLVGDHGLVPVLAAFDAVSGGKRMTARQLVWAAVKVLEPFVDPKELARLEREAEQVKVNARRFAPKPKEPWQAEFRASLVEHETKLDGSSPVVRERAS